MAEFVRIAGGKVYDPKWGVDGLVRDVLIQDGRVVAQLPENARPRIIDATGCVVMPGGIDIHCHIASSSVNRARRMQGEEHASHVHHACDARQIRSGTGQLTPSTFTTGYQYAAMGYTTAIEAAVSPTGARHAHLQLEDTPNLDAGFLLLLANHQHLIELLDARRDDAAVAFVSHMLRQSGAFGLKVVNPGGVASWRADAAHSVVSDIDQNIAGTSVTPRRILQLAATAAEKLALPHAPHIHCNNLGVPGNSETTLQTLRALEGRPMHLTHLQYHAYGRTLRGDFTSDAQRLVQYINEHPNVSADVGQVMFGSAFTVTADTPLEYLLWKLAGKTASPYVNIEGELEGGCGLMPFEYKNTDDVHSLQWAIGLELLLTCSDPWRMLLSTDHPNGASFLSYPRIIAALMSSSFRRQQMARASAGALAKTRLADLNREMTLSEIAIITRAGPARVLGLAHKGHLGAGADADVTIYDGNMSDPQRMFESPRYVIRAGTVVVEDGELRAPAPGRRFCAELAPSEEGERQTRAWFDKAGSYDVSQLGLHEQQRADVRAIAKGGA